VPRLFAGWPFAQLRASPDDRAFDSLELARWTAESSENALPEGGAPLAIQGTASGLGREVGGVYLFLEVVHPRPEELRVALTSPTGKRVEVGLPQGMSNFVGVIGHTWLPGAFAALSGGAADGTWTLELRDSGGGGGAARHLLEAAILLPKRACTPECAPANAATTAAAGPARFCVIGRVGFADGAREPGQPCTAALPGRRRGAWSPPPVEPSDTEDATRAPTAAQGACTGSIRCLHRGRPCHRRGLCTRHRTCASSGKRRAPCDDSDACTLEDHAARRPPRRRDQEVPAENCRESGPATRRPAPASRVPGVEAPSAPPSLSGGVGARAAALRRGRRAGHPGGGGGRAGAAQEAARQAVRSR
jgi:hypothetical protein